MNLRSDWRSLERYRCCYQRMEKVSPSRAHVRGLTFQTFLYFCAVKNKQLDKLSAETI